MVLGTAGDYWLHKYYVALRYGAHGLTKISSIMPHQLRIVIVAKGEMLRSSSRLRQRCGWKSNRLGRWANLITPSLLTSVVP